ncbi:purine-cytosine permease-like protein [Spinactinospora alkalitolerans]|uniref:Purine-cytosine permease-like protein n=1 Tax=Spinactinospora alkalitolerans TaxID=687207 RepID=A0A852TXP0_9ACTN|nr:cytosine permease [Spinactinospora alkalitolerans]NYE48057.1 purine-cytosine permease-like protein [Spinactinospora alkalitolerans]
MTNPTNPVGSAEADAAPVTEGITAVESYGIAPIPVRAQSSRPLDLFRLAFGGANTFATIILGTLPIAYGLGFWAAASATLVGVVIGALILSPMALFAPRTRTNNAISSGAHFGVVGRALGSFLSLLTAVTFFSISVWVSGDAIVGAALRFGYDGGAVLRALAYGAIAVAVFAVCIFGYQFMLLVNKVAVIAGSAIMLLGVFAYGGTFDPSYAGTGSYVLGEFWPTWVLAVVTAMANPVSFGAFLGDWARYIPATYSPRSLLAAPFLAQVATLLPFLFGVATATLVADPGDYVTGLAAVSPLWYALPLILVALIGGLSTGTTALYGTGLDFSSLFPRLNRVQGTAVVGTLALALIFVGSFAFNIVASINAFATLIVLLTSPWMVIMMVGYLFRRGHYLVEDLQVFNEGKKGGAYWFHRGVNWRGMAAWLPAAVVGLLFANTPLIVGPFANAAGGVDLSLVAALLTALVVYPITVVAFPEPRGVFGPDGPRLVPVSEAPVEAVSTRAAAHGADARESADTAV